jgi:filamentous hemagglutinin family protein
MTMNKMIKRFLFFSLSFLYTSAALSNPIGGSISAGNATIVDSPNLTTINQSTQKAVINWKSFNIAAPETTQFLQPAGGITLNRINPTLGASQIYGRLTATGQIILVNPAGIYFGPGSSVNVAGIIATTANITDQNFMKGNYQFEKMSGYSGSIINDGMIVAADHGLLALVAPGVINNGVVQANLGHVIMASGEAFTLNFSGNDLINFTISEKTSRRGLDQNGNQLSSGVTNTGAIYADGGKVLITAASASNILDNSIDMRGKVLARSFRQENGSLIISGNPDSGTVKVASNIDVSGKNPGETGGTVKITGDNITINSPTVIDASGDVGGGSIIIGKNDLGQLANTTSIYPSVKLLANAYSNGEGGFIETSAHRINITGLSVNLSAPFGKTGKWLIDPSDLIIDSSNGGSLLNAIQSGDTFNPDSGNSYLDVSLLIAALDNANIMVQTTVNGSGGNGDIFVNTPITWGSNNSLTLSAYNNINVNENIFNNNASSSAGVILQADNAGTGAGTITFASGKNVTLLGSGAVDIYYNPVTFGAQDTIYTGGTTPTQYMLIHGIGTDFTDTTTRSLATLSNLSALWNQNFALSKNIDASVTSSWNSGQGLTPIASAATPFTGKLDGQGYAISNLTIAPTATTNDLGLFRVLGNTGLIRNLGLISAVIHPASTNVIGIGALVGLNRGYIINSYSSGSVIGGNDNVGGLVGVNIDGGVIDSSYSSSIVSGVGSVGGLAGVNYNYITSIRNSYSTGTVTGTGENVGGLVGLNIAGSNIDSSYSSATVFGASTNNKIGGLVGRNSNSSSITNSYSTGTVTANAYEVGGLVGANQNGGFIDSSHSNSTVSGAGAVGGLVGFNYDYFSAISNSYSTGTVTGTDTNVGGLVGINLSAASIDASYSSASVFGTGYIGGLVGYNGNSYIGNSNASGSVTASGDNVGGLVGANENGSTIANSSSSTSITGTGSNIGGLVGLNQSSIISSFSSSTINGGSKVGGLIGRNQGSISGLSYSTGNVIGSGDNVGGLIGYNESSISDVYASGNVTGSGSGAGGLVGTNEGIVTNSYSTGIVIGNQYVGGLVGFGSGIIISSHSTSTVSGGSGVGGLMGSNFNSGAISDSYASGNVTGGGVNIGGLVGYSQGSILDSHASGTVTGGNGSFGTGGLLGGNDGSVTNSYSTGTVTGDQAVGGLVGDGSGVIDSSYSTSNVSGIGTVGGLIGGNFNSASIINSHATGNVTGGVNVGGLVGHSQGSILDSYASGTITSSGFGAGGLLGINDGSVTNSHSTGEVAGDQAVGGLVGANSTGSINASYSTSNVAGTGSVGGLVGGNYNNASINNSHATGNVIVFSNIGGLAGYNQGSISETFAIGMVTGSSGSFGTGGLLGGNDGSVTNSYSTGEVTGDQAVGGLVGTNSSGSIDTSYSTSTVSGTGTVGGLVGGNYNNSTINNSHASGNVIGVSDNVGGLAGLNQGSIVETYASGSVTSGSNSFGTGGLIGVNYGSTSNSYSKGKVIGNRAVGGLAGSVGGGNIDLSFSTSAVFGNTDVGGLIGGIYVNNALVNNSYATGNVKGIGDNTGGLVGVSYGSVFNSHSNNTVVGSDIVGGLIGLNIDTGTVINSYSTSNVAGNDRVGGLVGAGVGPSIIDNSYSASTVFGHNGVGGLVGLLIGDGSPDLGSINHAYSIGSVLGNDSVGGLVGAIFDNSGTVNFTYSTSPVSGNFNVGGLVGFVANSNNITNSFWDTETSGRIFSAAGTGATTAQLLNLTTFSNAGWSIGTDPNTNTWLIFNGQTRPMLGMEYSSSINTPHALQLININNNTLGVNYQLMNHIDLSMTNNPADIWAGQEFMPIGTPSPFSGTLDGQNHIVTLSLNLSSQNNVGLFGVTSASAVLSNIGIAGSVVGHNNVGMLAGSNAGTIFNTDSNGQVTGTTNVGGLVGTNSGTINTSLSAGSVTGSDIVGGLVGLNSNTIGNAYSIASVIGSAGYTGGLVGANTGNINNTYSSGLVMGPLAGGFAGNNTGTVTHSFWDNQTSNQVSSAGGIAATTTQLLSLATYNTEGWDIGTDPTTNTWLIFDGQTRPMLSMEYATNISNAHQLQLMGIDTTTLDASYTLSHDLDLSVIHNASDIWGGTVFTPLGLNTPFTGSFDGKGHKITHLNFDNQPSVPIALIAATSPAAVLSNLDISGRVLIGQTEFDFSNNNYLGGTFIKQFRLLFNPGDLTICTSCSSNVVLSGNNHYGTSNQLTLPVQDLIDMLQLANVYIQTSNGSGDIAINSDIQSGSAYNLLFNAYRDINADASITNTGGGSVVLSAGNSGSGVGTVNFTSGNDVTLSGGQGSVSIFYNPDVFGTQDTIYTGGTLATQYMLINSIGNASDTTTSSLAALSNRADWWNENFALSKDIDASATAAWNSGTGFSPIGNFAPGTLTFGSGLSFNGKFNGQGHIISNLVINQSTPQQGSTGLFGVTDIDAVISNVGLNNTHINVTLGFINGVQGYDVGSLIGTNFGKVSNVFSSNTVIEVNGQGYVNTIGGLIGWNASGQVDNAYSSGSINYNGTIDTDTVTMGGLIGWNNGNIDKTYTTTMIDWNSSGVIAGGLAGANFGNIQNSFWDTDTSGLSHAIDFNAGSTSHLLGGCFGGQCSNGGTVNLSTAETFRAANWNFDNTWGLIPDHSYPYLLSVYPDAPRAISGQIAQFTDYYSNPAWSAMPQNEMNPLWDSLTSIALSGQTVNLVMNGTILDSTTTSANGAYYFLERNEAIADSTPFLTYLSNSTDQANAVTIAAAGGASTSNLTLALNALLIQGNGSPDYLYTPPGGGTGVFSSISQTLSSTPFTLVTNDNLVSVLGGLASNEVMFGVSGNQINVANNTNFVTSPDVIFGLTNNLNTTHGSITFNGPTQIGSLVGNAITIQTNGGGNIETGNVISATSDVYTLNLNSANNIYLNGLLLLRDNNQAGQAMTNGSLNVSAAYTDQSITVNSSGGGYIVKDFNLLQGKWFQVGGYASTLSSFQINSGVMPSSVAEYLQLAYNSTKQQFVIPGIQSTPDSTVQVLIPQSDGSLGTATYIIPGIQGTPDVSVETLVQGYGQGTPNDPYIINSIQGLQGIGSNSSTLSLSYVFTGLSNSEMSSLWNYNNSTGKYEGFVPIGSIAQPFIGTFETNNTVNGLSNIYIYRPNTDNVGIFGVTGNTAVLSNIYMTKNSITGRDNVGGLVGFNQGTIDNTLGTQNFIVGNNNVGSLVGLNTGSLNHSESFNGRVLGHIAGGLVGYNSGTIHYSLASVYVGNFGTSSTLGGIAGINAGTIENSLWDIAVTGQNRPARENTGITSYVSGGCISSDCAIDLSDIKTYLTTADGGHGFVNSSWDFTNTWDIQAGMSYPYLNQIYDSLDTTPRVISGQLSPTSANELLVAVWGFDPGNEGKFLITNTNYLVTGADGSFYTMIPNDMFSPTAPHMLISALGGEITGSVFFNLLQPTLTNPTASQSHVPLFTAPKTNLNPTNLLALSNRQIDNIALGLPIDAAAGDSAFYLQQEYNIVYGNVNSGGSVVPLETPGIYYASYVYALALAESNPGSYYYFYVRDIYEEVREYLASHKFISSDLSQLIKNFQAWDASIMNRYDIHSIKPAFCGI